MIRQKIVSSVVVAAGVTSFALSTLQPRPNCESPKSPTLHQRWEKKWSKNELGWQKSMPHETLVKHHQKVFPKTENLTVLVPLCGKTVDLVYLNSMPNVGRVVGVEGVKQAEEEFAFENKDHNTDKINFLTLDFFKLPEKKIEFDVVWDRAALVAVDPSLRVKYVDVLKQVVKRKGGVILLSTFDRRAGTPEALAGGPPFSVSEDEVRTLFTDFDSIVKIDEIDILSNPNYESTAMGFRAAGLTDLREGVYVITNGDDRDKGFVSQILKFFQ